MDVSRGGWLVSGRQLPAPGVALCVTFPYDPSLREGQPEVPRVWCTAGRARLLLHFSLRGMRFRSQRGYAAGELLRIAFEGASSAPSPGAQEFRAKVVSLAPAPGGSGRRRLPRKLAGRPLHFAPDQTLPILRYTEI